jgi:outer membrane protein
LKEVSTAGPERWIRRFPLIRFGDKAIKMSKFRDILSLGVMAFVMTAIPHSLLVAANSDDKEQAQTAQEALKKKARKGKKAKKKSAPCSSKKQTHSSSFKQSKSPAWLKIEHAPIAHLKEGFETLTANHPFIKALTAAYNYSPQIKAKLREYYSTAEGLSQAYADFRPTINGQVQTGYSVTDNQNPDPTSGDQGGASSTNPRSASINVTQNLYKGGGTIAGMNSAKNQVRAARADFLSTEQDVLLAAIQAYLEVWFQQERVKTIETSEKFYKENLDQVKAQAEVGESSTITDVAQAEFSYENSVAKRTAAEADLENARTSYIKIIGEKPPAVLSLPTSVREIISLPKSLEEFLRYVEKYNPSIIKAQYNYSSYKDNIDVAAAELLPSVDLVGTAGRGIDSSRRNARQNDASVTLRMTIPILNKGGADWAGVRKSEQLALQKKHELQASIDTALQQIKQTWKQVEATKIQIQKYEAAIKAGDVRTEGTRQEYLVGERSLLEVLQSEADTVDARLSLLQEQRDYLLNGYTLLSSVGELTAEVLKLPVARYDLNTYPETVRDQWIGWDKPEPSHHKRGAAG